MCPSQVPETKTKPDTTPQPHVWPPQTLAIFFLLALFAAYANHFRNSFHFDDINTITRNPAIRSLAEVPHFFTDARTFSTLPSHHTYRPIVSASVALDYWLGGGLDPLWFHISTFAWYILQLGLMYLLFVRILNLSRPSPNNSYVALLATA